MKLLDRYIFKQFLWNFLLVLGGVLSLYLLIDFFEKIDNFTEHGKSIGYALQFLLLNIPAIYFQLSPVCILLAGIITLGILNQNKETIALNAGGVSFIRIITPLMISSIIITFTTIAISQWALPITIKKVNTIWNGEIRQKISKGIIRNTNIFCHSHNGISTFTNDNNPSIFKNFLYTSWDQQHNLTLFISAKQATYNEKKSNWTFTNGIKKTRSINNDFHINIFDTLTLNLPVSPTDFFTPIFLPEEHSISELWTRAHDDSVHAATMQRELQSRLSFIFLGLPLLLFAIPITTSIHNKWGRDLNVAIPCSCGLAFIIWGIWSTLQSLAKLSILSPLISSWSVHFVASIIAFFWIRRQNSHGA